MLGLTRALVPRLSPATIQVTSQRTKYYKVEGEDFIRITPPDPGNPNLMVGNWPRTKEERERAAKKYNLIPEDYKPFDEGDGWGDYPDLKAIGAFNRDPYDDFDDPVDNRFYNETLHVHYDMYMWERIDPLHHEKGHWSYKKKAAIMAVIVASLPALKYFMETFRIQINRNYKARPLWPNPYVRYEFPTKH